MGSNTAVFVEVKILRRTGNFTGKYGKILLVNCVLKGLLIF